MERAPQEKPVDDYRSPRRFATTGAPGKFPRFWGAPVLWRFIGGHAAADFTQRQRKQQLFATSIHGRLMSVFSFASASAIQIGAGAIWMQEGVVHEEGAQKARAAGLTVVMDRCILKEHMRLLR